MKYLFIGGVKNGQWIDIPNNDPIIQVPAIPNPREEEMEVLWTVDKYQRVSLCESDERRYFVYILEQWE